MQIDSIKNLHCLPDTCSYRLIEQGLSLPQWHPLLTGSKKTMHDASASMDIVYLIEVQDWEDHIVDKIDLL